MIFDYSKLLGRMREADVSQEELADKISVSRTSMNLKLNNKANFKQPEILAICSELGILGSDIGIYFFTAKV